MNSELSPESGSEVNRGVGNLSDPLRAIRGACASFIHLFLYFRFLSIFPCLALNFMLFSLFIFFPFGGFICSHYINYHLCTDAQLSISSLFQDLPWEISLPPET